MAVHRLVLRLRHDLHCAALGRVERDDVVALLHAGDARADVDDDAGAFVAEDGREEPFGIGARAGELVGVADAGGLDLDEHLAGARPFELDLLDDERLAGFVGDGGAGLHRNLRAQHKTFLLKFARRSARRPAAAHELHRDAHALLVVGGVGRAHLDAVRGGDEVLGELLRREAGLLPRAGDALAAEQARQVGDVVRSSSSTTAPTSCLAVSSSSFMCSAPGWPMSCPCTATNISSSRSSTGSSLARERGAAGGARGGDQAQHALLEERLLRRKVQVEPLARQPGRAREIVHRRLLEAVAQEHARGGVEDAPRARAEAFASSGRARSTRAREATRR